MMTSTRPRDVGGSFASRRGHSSQLSISDPSHHVTEAIGTMYGEDDDSAPEDARPLSFIASKYGGEQLEKAQKLAEPAEDRPRLVRTTSDQTGSATYGAAQTNGIHGGSGLRKAQTHPTRTTSDQSNSYEGAPSSPTPPFIDMQSSPSTAQFPLTSIDNPNDIAQELSNLQALRRMSMDVGNTTTDPDLLAFSGVSLMAMPSIAPTGDDDEADPSRLLWVPARVHPELEPTAFKNFLENRVQTMKRRSGDSFLSADGVQRNNSGSLRRKKSMLSRQINPSSENGDGYVDGAERLERQRSLTERPTPELSLSELVTDPAKVVQKLAQETRQESGEGDSPILPVAPGMGLRRSTKTTYRKGGSQRYGDRAPFSKRVAERQAEKDNSEEPPPVPSLDPSIGKPLTRVQSEPIMAENYSRPTRTVRRQQNFSRDTPSPTALDGSAEGETGNPATASTPQSTTASPAMSSPTPASRTPPPPVVPQIVETPPADDNPQPAELFPPRSAHPDQPLVDGPPARSSKRPAPNKHPQPSVPPAKTSTKEQTPAIEKALSEISHPHPLPGSGGTTTSSLTFIPTFDTVDRKADRKSKDKDDNDSILSHKSTSGWKWFKSDDKEKKRREKEKEKEKEREREREREREKEREELSKKARAKAAEKNHENARLDVLQSSVDVLKGRESLRLDRNSIDSIPHDERKKETNRKSSDGKKEREGFFGGLFGGSKKKGDKDSSHKKKEHRPLTPEPPPRILRPDVDYHWTRFPIIEERAIYRMAHIKLANPRRSLHSQVLLSNFMYSYLAKVQAMHPQLQIPISPQQKRLEEERKRQEAEQTQLQLGQQMAQQGALENSFNFEYHRAGNRYGDAPLEHDGSAQYVDDAQIYDYEHGDNLQNGGAQDSYGHEEVQGQAQGQGQGHVRQGSGPKGSPYALDTKRFDDDDENSDMW
ncbi:hypothetical protein VTK56DRAFT_6793 [Thermocarpiscus australiensis]